MGISKTLIGCVLLTLLVVQLVQATDETNQVTTNSVSDKRRPLKINCRGACAARCKLSSRPNLCQRACGTCCARCGCVPPGTSGNYGACPCYASLTTHGHQRKCP